MTLKTMSVSRDGTVTERFLTGAEEIEFEARRSVRRDEVRPRAITKVRLVRQLRIMGEWNRVRNRLDMAPAGVVEDWKMMHIVRRNDRNVIQAMGLTKAQLDTLFSEGQAL